MALTVLVDDSDPGIQYSGPWTPENPMNLGQGFEGINSSLGNTVHSGTSNEDGEATFTFSFNGDYNLASAHAAFHNYQKRQVPRSAFSQL